MADQIEEKKDAALTNDDGINPTKGKAGLPVGNNNNGDSMPTLDTKDGPSSKVEVIQYVATYLAGLDTETAVNFYNKLKAEYASKDATNGGGEGTAKGASNKDSIKTHKEDFDALFAGEDLSEEFKTKVSTIFEAALALAITTEVARLEEANEAKIVESVAAIQEELTAKVDGHLAHVTEKWLEENKIAVESQLRVEAVDSFLTGMKSLFAEHYVSVPAEAVDVVESLNATVETLEAKVNEEVATSIALRSELNALKAEKILESKIADLPDTSKDKVRKLAESVEVSDDYATKIDALVEAVANTVAPSAQPLNESAGLADPVEPVVADAPKLDPVMEMYVKSISRSIKR